MMQDLAELLRTHDDWLIERVLHYAKQRGYTKYTSTLKEAWRQAIHGLSASLIDGLQRYQDAPELGPDDDYRSDPMTRFGVIEAQRHRQRGTTLDMFLGLMKYYRQSYHELLAENVHEPSALEKFRLFVERSFDRIEIAFCKEWSVHERDDLLGELQHTNRRMTNEKNAYLTVFESLADPAFLLNDRDEIQNLNHAAARLLSPENVPGSHYYLPGRDAALQRSARDAVDVICACPEGHYELGALPWLPDAISELRDKPPGTVVMREVEIRGQKNWFEIHYSRMLDFSEKFSGTILTLRDVTARQHADHQRRTLENRFQKLQKLESLAVLAGGVAHDFNNLLVGVLGHAELARDLIPADSPAQPLLEKIERAAHRSADLIKQMLAYSGKGRFVIAKVDLSKLVGDMTELLRASIPKTALLRFELAANLPTVEADATQLGQIVMNLVINAAEALEDGRGTVVLRTGVAPIDRASLSTSFLDEQSASEACVFLEVSDDGHGMDEALRSKIFDPFFSTKFAGRGLGLAAVHGIVRGHRGAIRVRSRPGEGSVFEVFFPIAAAAPSVESDAALPPRSGARRKTILVVDDEEEVRSVVKMILERHGYLVLTAVDGLQGIEIFRRRRDQIDLVLLDLMMPGANGTEVLAEIRKLHARVPVILSSGYDEQITKLRTVDQETIRFIQKPYPLTSLIESIDSAFCDRVAPARVSAGQAFSEVRPA